MNKSFNKNRYGVRGDSGQILMVAVVGFTVVALVIVFGITSPIIRQVQTVRNFQISKQSYFTAEAGSEDVFYRIKNNLTISSPEVVSLGNAIATVTVSTTGPGEQEILSEGNASNLIRSVVKNITVTDGFEFSFAVQVGPGGLRMQNDSDVIGNVYSSGPIDGDDNDKNYILGDAVSSGPGGSIDEIHATSSAYAHTITDSKIDKDAYYVTKTNTTVTGTSYPGSPDQPSVSMPIAEFLLDQWEADAVAGGTISSPCPYNINSNVTLGPKKIDCDVRVYGNNTVVPLTGTLWINGNLTIDNDPEFKVADSVGNKSVPVVAHSTSNPTTKGMIDINNEPNFYGSETGGVANPDSYIMFISRNTSAESGGTVKAITAGNHVTGNLLLYAPHGAVELSNEVILREVTSYSLTLKNNTQVYYNIGLAQPLFTTGPGGAWKIKRWKETKPNN